MSERILIAGCGRLGARLGQTLAAAGHQVFGLRRFPASLPDGIEPVAANLLEDPLPAVLPSALDRVYYILTPPSYDDAGYQAAYVQGLSRLLPALQTTGSGQARLIFVSSTGVYGQSGGEWVDEHSPTQPTRFSGQRLLEAESFAATHGGESISVRFSGIYGPDRDALVRRVRRGGACSDQPPRYTNRIHEDDCVGVLGHLGTLPSPAPVYVATDNHPCTQCEIMDWMAAALGCPTPPREGGDNAGRRCSNQRLVASGYRFRHPDYRSGYAYLRDRSGV